MHCLPLNNRSESFYKVAEISYCMAFYTERYRWSQEWEGSYQEDNRVCKRLTLWILHVIYTCVVDIFCIIYFSENNFFNGNCISLLHLNNLLPPKVINGEHCVNSLLTSTCITKSNDADEIFTRSFSPFCAFDLIS